MNEELLKDYEVLFIKMYRDFANTYVAYEYTCKNEVTKLNTLRHNFLSDSVENYKEHILKVLDRIEEEFSYEISQDILKKNTREYQFNEILRMLNISKDDLINILNFDTYTVEQWFSYEQANPLKQNKIRDLYDFLYKIQELFKGNYNLLDLLKYSFIDTSDLVFDEDDKDKLCTIFMA